MKKILIFVITLSIAFSSSAEIFKLVSAKVAPDEPLFPPAIIKIYKPTTSKPINVKYGYYFDIMDNDERFYIKFNKNDSSLRDITNNVYDVNYDKSYLTKKFHLPTHKIKESCEYYGYAKISIEFLQVLLTEGENDGSSYYAVIKNILIASKPQVKCQ